MACCEEHAAIYFAKIAASRDEDLAENTEIHTETQGTQEINSSEVEVKAHTAEVKRKHNKENSKK